PTPSPLPYTTLFRSEREIPAGQQLHLLLQEFEGLLERRLLRHVAASFTCTWIRPSWKRTARASPTSTSAAWATTCPSSRSAIAYPRCKVATRLRKARRRPTVPTRSRCRRIPPGPDKLPDRHVGPVAERADAGDATRRHRARQAFVVEAPEILEGAAPARDDHDVDAGRDRGEGAAQARGRSRSLDEGRRHNHMGHRIPPQEDRDDVVHHGADLRRHDADPTREWRE